jgi:predicted DNA-binding protein with PD1-like motif
MLKIHVAPGREVLEVLEQECARRRITSGAIVSVIGAVDACGLSTMPKDDPRRDLLTEYTEPLELAGTGEIRAGKPHIHCVLGREGNAALAGHLHWGRVATWYVHAFVIPATDTE